MPASPTALFSQRKLCSRSSQTRSAKRRQCLPKLSIGRARTFRVYSITANRQRRRRDEKKSTTRASEKKNRGPGSYQIANAGGVLSGRGMNACVLVFESAEYIPCIGRRRWLSIALTTFFGSVAS